MSTTSNENQPVSHDLPQEEAEISQSELSELMKAHLDEGAGGTVKHGSWQENG
jgi:hypothetical protein